MKDKNGKTLGVLAHIVKTHITESKDDNMISAMNKNLDNIKINNQMTNEEILSYTYPKSQTNKKNVLSKAVDASSINK